MTNGEKLEMITIEKPNKPYLLLERLNRKNSTKKERNLHVIFPS